MHRVLVSRLWHRLWGLCPLWLPGCTHSHGSYLLFKPQTASPMTHAYTDTQLPLLFLLPFLISHPLWHVNHQCVISLHLVFIPCLTLSLSLSVSRSLSLLLLPLLWHGEREGRGERRRQEILHALNTASTCVGCCHQRREGTGFISYYVSVCATVCIFDRVCINSSKHQRCPLIYFSVFRLFPSLPLPPFLCNSL